jgi:hypothetical protein
VPNTVAGAPRAASITLARLHTGDRKSGLDHLWIGCDHCTHHHSVARSAGSTIPRADLRSIVHATADAEIPIAPAAPPPPISRGFLPWRLSDTGPGACRPVAMGRHPKPFTRLTGPTASERCPEYPQIPVERIAPQRNSGSGQFLTHALQQIRFPYAVESRDRPRLGFTTAILHFCFGVARDRGNSPKVPPTALARVTSS